MKYAFVFGVLSLACGYLGATAQSLWAKCIALSLAIAFAGVAMGYAHLGARVFGKKRDGKLRAISYVLYWPYFALSYFSLFCFRLFSRENAFDLVDDNVYLGCRIFGRDVPQLKKLGIQSVLDLTCEFGELRALRQKNYLCIPILDTCAPSLDELKTGAQWIEQQSQNGPVYVHCALGHGRSATFVAAYLLSCGRADNVDTALELIASRRPKIELHEEQIEVLQQLALCNSR
jgi:protein-tyrosine phosphatase